MMKKCGLYLGFITLLFCSAPPGYAVMSKDYGGSNYLSETVFSIDYYLQNGRVIIRDIDWYGIPSDAYPCEALWRKKYPNSRFGDCELVRHLSGAREERKFTGARDLTQAEFYAFLTRKGDVGAQTQMHTQESYYALQITTIGGTQGGYFSSYIPRGRQGGTGGEVIPPGEPENPTLTCSVNGGNLNYGTVSSDKLDNLEAELKISAGCSGLATFTLKAASGYDNSRGIALNNGGALRALLSIDGYPAGYGERYTSNGYKTITIKSRLSKQSSQVTVGKYTGSVVLVMDTE